MPGNLFKSGAPIWRVGRSKLVVSHQRLFSTCRPSLHPKQQSDFLEHFIREKGVPEAAKEHFSALSWARGILQDDAYETIPFFSQYRNERTGENRFLANVAGKPTMIPHILFLRTKTLRLPENDIDPTKGPPDVMCFMSLGPDMTAHPGMVHGGFQCVIYDEVLRILILLHENQIRPPTKRTIHFTANLATTYLAPLVAPNDVLARAWLTARTGRKWELTAEILDNKGTIVSRAESTWVTARQPPDS